MLSGGRCLVMHSVSRNLKISQQKPDLASHAAAVLRMGGSDKFLILPSVGWISELSEGWPIEISECLAQEILDAFKKGGQSRLKEIKC